jgi:GTPase SAR1 family protein
MSGKTTSLKNLFKYFGKQDTLKSIESTTGRTLFFDFGVLNFQGSEWNIKFLIYSATGQDFYASTRPATIIGVDGIIFIVDSQKIYLKQNLRSWNELLVLFSNILYQLPVIICLNKWDLENKIEEVQFLNEINYHLFEKVDIVKTVATNGLGVIDSFKKMLNFIFPQINIQII